MYNLIILVKVFYEDLVVLGMVYRVLSMFFLEFGRRIEQNVLGGIDYGVVVLMILFGEGLNGNGFLGVVFDFQNLD